jgi:DNA-binding MarR family transcriptional regulator
MNSERSEADLLHRSLVQLRHAVLRDGFLQAVRAMDEFELSVAQMATLMLLDAEGGGTVGGLAADLGRSLSATSRLIDQLVRRELVSRHEDDRDRRVKRITLTPRGSELIGLVQRQRSEAQRVVMEALSASERAEVMRGMALLAEAADRRRAAATPTTTATATYTPTPTPEPAEAVPIPAVARP